MPLEKLGTFPGVPPLVAQLLHNRCIETQAQLEAYLGPGRGQLLDPFMLPDMEKAVARLRRALANKEHIGIFGDFDADGVTATALLVMSLEVLGASVLPYIPHRVEEGHGLNVGALQKLKELGASVVITADCGVSSVQEVAQAQGWGLDVIITDHHSPPATLPQAHALINPKISYSAKLSQDLSPPSSPSPLKKERGIEKKLGDTPSPPSLRLRSGQAPGGKPPLGSPETESWDGSPYPFPHLTGVGVAFKLIQGLYTSLGRSWDERLLALAAIGTVADVAPITGENRAILKEGLRVLNTGPGVGLAALIDAAGLRPGQVDAEAIGYSIAPRLNATGRLDTAVTSYRLLTTTSPEEAAELAASLNQWNHERQELTRQMLEQARADVLAKGPDRPLLWVMDSSYHSGVIGLVAGRLVEEFYRPSIVVQVGEVYSRGSCRSIPEFDVIDALSACSSFFERFGGHRQAAGFTIRTELLSPLQRHLEEMAAERLSAMDLTPTLMIDAEVSFAHLNGKVLGWVQRMAPFGSGNPSPAFLSRGVQIVERHTWGGNQEHWRMRLKQGNAIWQGVAYSWDPATQPLSDTVDLVYQLGVDRWTGEDLMRLEVLDMRPGS